MKINSIMFLVFLGASLPSHGEERGAPTTQLDLNTLGFDLPTAIRLRIDLAVLQRPEYTKDLQELGVNGMDVQDARTIPSSWVAVYKARDGVVFLTDKLNMALWLRQDNGWKCLVAGLRVDKTFGGAPPSLPALYLGNGLFAITETVPGHVKEESKDGFPQARAVTFLIDSMDGKVKERSESFVYDHNPPVRVPASWLMRYKIKSEQAVPSDGHKPSSRSPSTDPIAPADAH
jgi:hypothetical protein